MGRWGGGRVGGGIWKSRLSKKAYTYNLANTRSVYSLFILKLLTFIPFLL